MAPTGSPRGRRNPLVAQRSAKTLSVELAAKLSSPISVHVLWQPPAFNPASEASSEINGPMTPSNRDGDSLPSSRASSEGGSARRRRSLASKARTLLDRVARAVSSGAPESPAAADKTVDEVMSSEFVFPQRGGGATRLERQLPKTLWTPPGLGGAGAELPSKERLMQLSPHRSMARSTTPRVSFPPQLKSREVPLASMR